MGDWIKKVIDQTKKLWAKWSLVQKLILVGICVAAIVGITALFAVSASPTLVPVFSAPIRDESARNQIVTRINEEGVRASVGADGVVMVADEQTARRMRAILIREDLVPRGTNPWEVFDRERWTITDMERNVNVQRAITQIVTDHIRAIEGIDNAHVTLVFPRDSLFARDQNPVTASVIITPSIGSNVTEDRKKVEGIQRLIKLAVEGLRDENIVIADHRGHVLNDFDDMAESDRIANIRRATTLIRNQEALYRAAVLRALQSTYTSDRVRDLNVNIDMDLSKVAIQRERIEPIMMRERTPGLAYDDSERMDRVPLSENITSTTYRGTGINPEGPPGAEGQMTPVFRDSSTVFGEVVQETRTANYLHNRSTSQEERVPSVDRVSVSTNIDGVWNIVYDDRGRAVVLPNGSIQREYTPLTTEEIAQARRLIEGAIGFSPARGDSVVVTNIQFDRAEEFRQADADFLYAQNLRTTILIALGIIAAVVIFFVVFRAVSKEMDRRRRLQDEERARREAAEREQMLMAAEKGSDIPLSPEEQARMSMYENVASMAKDHPDAVAALIRTWLLEE